MSEIQIKMKVGDRKKIILNEDNGYQSPDILSENGSIYKINKCTFDKKKLDIRFVGDAFRYTERQDPKMIHNKHGKIFLTIKSDSKEAGYFWIQRYF